MRKDLISETTSKKAGLWNSVVRKGKNPLGGLQITNEMIEHIERYNEKRKKLVEECAARGHQNSESQGMGYFRDALTVYMRCNDCEDYYSRSQTIDEEKSFARGMNCFVD